MTERTETILDRIVVDKREELAAAKPAMPLAALKARIAESPQPRPFAEALRSRTPAIIAEVKKASPSRGVLLHDFDPVALAKQYAAAGAAAISILTDEKHFQGSLDHLSGIHAALPEGPPLLRKDFLFETYQLYEARCHGADAVLLITAILEPQLLAELVALAETLALAALVEVHDETELGRAVSAGARIIGINNRDLRTFEVDLTVTERLAPLVPRDRIVVAESGIFTREHIDTLAASGVHAFLIGEALVTAPDPGASIRELIS